MSTESTRGEPVTEHYDRLAPHFVQHWAYSPEFVQWMTGRLAHWLDLAPARRLLDVGCGPGLYAQRLAAHTSEPITCADPSREMLAQLDDEPRLHPLHASAEELAARDAGAWDAILLKESLHHVAGSKRRAVLHGLAHRLAPGGRIVLVMMPTELDRPMPASARQRLRQAKFTPDSAAKLLAEAGLTVTTGEENFEVTMPTTRYAAMLQDRYMTLLNKVEEAELERTIAELSQQEQLSFRDRYAFIAAYN